MNWLKENWFKVGILAAAMLVAYSIYSFLVVQPKQESAPAETPSTKGTIDNSEITPPSPRTVKLPPTPEICLDFEKKKWEEAKIIDMAVIHPPRIPGKEWTSGTTETSIFRIFYSAQNSTCEAASYTAWKLPNGDLYLQEVRIGTQHLGTINDDWRRDYGPSVPVTQVTERLAQAVEYFIQNGRGPN